MNTANRWHGAVRLFHWGSVLLLVAVWAMIMVHENTPDENYTFINLHKALGVVFAVWVLARIITRFKLAALAPAPAGATKLMNNAASSVHFMLYACMLAMPLTGSLMSQYAGYPTNMFGLFTIPVVLAPSEQLQSLFHTIHTDIVWVALLTLTAGHIAAAWYHQLVLKDGLINRMR